ncbi:MAG TPA: hypothetical protein VNH18_34500 [Bryobacteraceae bacterium]|nr:hypothetical protein [Bryobacteraceae bacterium]
MDPFRQRAVAILETAQMGSVSDMTVLFGGDGALRLIMGQGSSLAGGHSAEAESSTYHLTRRGNRIQVTGSSGTRTCQLEAEAAPRPRALLLNDQPLYQVIPAMAALPSPAVG